MSSPDFKKKFKQTNSGFIKISEFDFKKEEENYLLRPEIVQQ